MTSEAGRRCRVWELNLPVKGQFWWRAHYGSLLLGGFSLILIYSLIPILLNLLDAEFQNSFFHHLLAGNGISLWKMFALPLFMYWLALDIVVIWFPASAQPGSEKGWSLRLGFLITAFSVLLLLISRQELLPMLLLVVGGMGIIHARIKIPDTLSLPRLNSGTDISVDWSTGEISGKNPFLLYKTIMKLLFKWPVNWLMLLTFIVLFGMFLGGFNPITDDPDSMRFSNFFMCVYVLLASAGHFTEKLHLIDHLPVARGIIFACLVFPAILALAFGYVWGNGRLRGGMPEKSSLPS